jgi:hypothetical protein
VKVKVLKIADGKFNNDNVKGASLRNSICSVPLHEVQFWLLPMSYCPLGV